MAITIKCNRCGASYSGSAVEGILWDSSHDKFCPRTNPTEGASE